MRITPKVLDEAIAESAGEEVLPLIKILKKRKNISEFKLAEGIKREVNKTRNLLYKLYNANLVSFERIKDKKKGWYVYYWTFNQNKVKDLVISLKKQRLERLRDKLKKEENNKFYSCKEKCLRLDFEQSFDFEFKCPECGELLEEDDNTDKIQDIKAEISRIEKELKTKPIIVLGEKPEKIIKKKPVKKEKKKIVKKKVKKKVTKKKPKKKKAVKKKTIKKPKKTKKKVIKKKIIKKKKTIKRK